MVLVILTSCAKIYYSPDAYKPASNQQTVATLLPSVSIAAGKRVEAEALKEQQRTEAVNFQKEIYSWMLRRKMQGIGIPAAISTIIKRYTLEQVITNQRVIQKKGLISRKIEEMRLSKIETVEYSQGVFGRIMGFGSVKISGTLTNLQLFFS